MNDIIFIIRKSIKTLIELLRQNKKVRKIILISTLIIFIISVSVAIYFNYFSQLEENIKKLTIKFSLIVLFFLLLIINSYTTEEFQVELEDLREERKELKDKIIKDKDDKEEDIFNTIKLNLNQISEYYTINKSQAKKSFNMSLFAIIIGLVTIISGIWIFYINKNSHINISIITTIAGIILEFIGGAYFYMYKENTRQLNYFYSELVDMQDIMLSIKLCNSLSDEKIDKVKERIIVSLIKRSSRENENRYNVLNK